LPSTTIWVVRVQRRRNDLVGGATPDRGVRLTLSGGEGEWEMRGKKVKGFDVDCLPW